MCLIYIKHHLINVRKCYKPNDNSVFEISFGNEIVAFLNWIEVFLVRVTTQTLVTNFYSLLMHGPIPIGKEFYV